MFTYRSARNVYDIPCEYISKVYDMNQRRLFNAYLRGELSGGECQSKMKFNHELHVRSILSTDPSEMSGYFHSLIKGNIRKLLKYKRTGISNITIYNYILSSTMDNFRVANLNKAIDRGMFDKIKLDLKESVVPNINERMLAAATDFSDVDEIELDPVSTALLESIDMKVCEKYDKEAFSCD